MDLQAQTSHCAFFSRIADGPIEGTLARRGGAFEVLALCACVRVVVPPCAGRAPANATSLVGLRGGKH